MHEDQDVEENQEDQAVHPEHDVLVDEVFFRPLLSTLNAGQVVRSFWADRQGVLSHFCAPVHFGVLV